MDPDQRYQIIEPLGQGGMGKVFRARDAVTGEEVALKLVDTAGPRAQREIDALARLDHPGIVTIHATFTTRHGLPALVLDLLPGSLADRLQQEGCLTEEEAVTHAIALAEALDHAHLVGVLHRDLKPANVLLRQDGRPVLTDFGLAHLADERERLTRTGELLGTPEFLSPEQADGDLAQIGPTTDIYGLGATLFAMLTGKPPFKGTTAVNTVRAVLMDKPPRASAVRPGLSREIDLVVARCLAKDPSKRYPTAMALVAGLQEARRRDPRRRSTTRFVAPLAAAAVLLVGGVLWSARPQAPLETVSSRTLPSPSESPPRVSSLPPRVESPSGPPTTPPPTLTPDDVQQLWLLLRQNPAQARQRLEAHLERAGADANAWTLLARAHRRLSDLEGALAALARALEFDSQAVEPRLLRAELRCEAQEQASALTDVRVVLDRDPKHVEALRLELRALNGRISIEETESLLSALIAAARGASPDSAAAWRERGKTLIAGRLEGTRGYDRALEAIESFEQAIDLDPTDGHALAELANARWRAAAQDTRAGARTRGAAWRQEQLRRAEIDAREAVEADPYDASAHYNLGSLLRETDPRGAAYAMLRRAELIPWLPGAWVLAGTYAANAGLFAEADSAFTNELASQPNDYDALFGRGFVRLSLKRPDAIDDLHRALELAPDDAARRHIENLLRQTEPQPGR